MSKTLWFSAALLCLFALPVCGQRAHGYAFIAPGALSCCGGSQSTLHGGIGADVRLVKGLSAGVEAGAVGPTRRLTDGFGVISANGYYHFLPSDNRLDPFVTGGYSFLWSFGHVNAGNYGGGMNYWFSRHFGARIEFRDHIRTEFVTAHYWGVRFGIAFH